MADRIRNLQNKLKSKIESGDTLSAVVAYVPLIGWIIADSIDKKKDELVKFHIKQSKEINLAIILIYVFVWFIENFPLTSWLFGKNKLFFPIIESFWLLSFLSYLGISLFSSYKALNDEIWSYPYRNIIKNKINVLLKKSKH
ncbi:MAG: hypothetical protein ACK4UJ_08100 [Leptonema sp. (in: bacteria)]